MKHIFLYGILFLVFAFVGCLDDKGNYDFVKLQEPEWKKDIINLYFREGDIARF